jgi:hypothetical protein
MDASGHRVAPCGDRRHLECDLRCGVEPELQDAIATNPSRIGVADPKPEAPHRNVGLGRLLEQVSKGS